VCAVGLVSFAPFFTSLMSSNNVGVPLQDPESTETSKPLHSDVANDLRAFVQNFKARFKTGRVLHCSIIIGLNAFDHAFVHACLVMYLCELEADTVTTHR
jgi:hypothetical protein